MIEKKYEYETSDLCIAATLVCYGYRISRIEPSVDGSPRKVFVIDADKKLAKVIEKYWTKKLKVEPTTFFYAVRNIKSMVRDLFPERR